MKELRTFEHFPKQITCPVCGTNEDAECVLCLIDGTDKEGICEAQPVHLRCAVAERYIRDLGILYTKLQSTQTKGSPATESGA
jgi:transcription elongation factor Elf1